MSWRCFITQSIVLFDTCMSFPSTRTNFRAKAVNKSPNSGTRPLTGSFSPSRPNTGFTIPSLDSEGFEIDENLKELQSKLNERVQGVWDIEHLLATGNVLYVYCHGILGITDDLHSNLRCESDYHHFSRKEDYNSSSSINKRSKSPLVTNPLTGFNSSISEADRLVEKRRTLELEKLCVLGSCLIGRLYALTATESSYHVRQCYVSSKIYQFTYEQTRTRCSKAHSNGLKSVALKSVPCLYDMSLSI
jgi:hypothetical protein